MLYIAQHIPEQYQVEFQRLLPVFWKICQEKMKEASIIFYLMLLWMLEKVIYSVNYLIAFAPLIL